MDQFGEETNSNGRNTIKEFGMSNKLLILVSTNRRNIYLCSIRPRG